MLAGDALALVSVLQFRSLQRMSGLQADRLFRTGVYRWSRNPQNVGWFAVLLGFGLMQRSAGSIGLVFLFALTLHVYIVYMEEPYGQAVFGATYRRYRVTRPRYLWIPRAERGAPNES